MRRVGIIGAMLIAFGLIGGHLPSFAGDVDRDAEQRSFDLLNGERTERGKSALRWSSELASVARSHSQDMADDGELSHNSGLQNDVDDWEELGENVGTGGDVEVIHDMFMDSASHRANILGSFVEVGVGVIEQDGALWLTQVFRTPTPPEQVDPPKRKTRWTAESSTRRTYRAANPTSVPVRSVAATKPRRAAPPATRAVEMLNRLEQDFEAPMLVSRYCKRDPRDC